MSKTITLAPLDRNETGRSGCIGTDTPDGPIAGFAEVDPNGLWSSPDEADEIAAEVCRRWNIMEAGAWAEVMAERRRQVEVKGFTAEHDDKHSGGIAAAAGCYALHSDAYPNAGQPPPAWPWEAEWWKPKDYRRDMVRAAALLLAEIERLDRAAAKSPADA